MTLMSRLAQGGQTCAHGVRMLRQVIKIGLSAALSIGCVTFIVRLLWADFNLLIAGWYHLKALAYAELQWALSVNSAMWHRATGQLFSAGQTLVSPEQVLRITTPLCHQLLHALLYNLMIAGMVAAASCAIILGFFALRGNLATRRKHLEGRKLVSAKRLAWTLKVKGQASDIRLHNLPLVKGAETQHMMITGGTGSGKTNCLHHLLPQIKKRGDKLILLDPTGTLADRYFQPGDTLLNPLDERSAQWHPWAECRDRMDYDSLAESIIPHNHQERDAYWSTAARSLLSTVLEKCSGSAKTSDLRQWLLYEPLYALCAYVENTRAASFLDISSEKTAASVRSVAASYLPFLEYLPDADEPFSIRDWIADEGSDWLYLHCSPPQRATLSSLMTCWFSIATRSLLHLPPDFNRKIWFVVDELPSLNRVKDIDLFLAEARKYGGCAVLTLQSPAQLDNIYGRQSTQTIVGNCATKVAFCERDPEVSEKISRTFGKREFEEYREGISYGSHQMRDGVTLSKTSRQKPVVSPTDLQSLKPNDAYASLPGEYPVTRIVLPIKGRSDTGTS